jgi:hypothetical protein
MDIATVDATIESAFAGVVRDENCTLHQAQLRDQTLDRDIPEAEWRSAKDTDRETDWRQISDAALDECDAALSHATPQSWRFYLPAYMRRALRLLDADLLDTFLPGSVVFHLTYARPSPSSESYILDRFKMLDSAQGKAVSMFLEYVRDYPAARTSYRKEAELALRKYWGLDEQKRPQGPKIIVP